MSKSLIKGLFLECTVQDESEPGGMFSDYQNFGTYGANYPGINKRRMARMGKRFSGLPSWMVSRKFHSNTLFRLTSRLT